MSRGLLVLLGSGETTPGMVKVHRDLLGSLERVDAVNLDTSYGFQENVPQMNAKLVDYFATSLRTTLATIHYPSYDAATSVERALVKRRVREATYVFAGPGSPSYALAQWRPLGLRDDLAAVLEGGGVVCFASAAAVTIGERTAPIYEIYKAGAEPHWLEGLDLTALAGLRCVVIPHFDNAEGATHDTRYCYLGERRLRVLEAQLEPDVAVLGIDEHTAVIIDLAARTLHVRGRANAHWRHAGHTRVLENGSTTSLEDLSDGPPVTGTVAADEDATTPPSVDPTATALDLARVVSVGGPSADEALAQLVTLADQGGRPSLDADRLIEAVLAARSVARENKDFALSDVLRDVLLAAGVEISDGPTGSTWAHRPPSD